jgi:hypothetical protein
MNIKVKCDRPGYPLGSNMDGAVKLIEAYVKAFKQIGYGTNKVLNLWCRGSSGAILAGMFAIKHGHECTICHVKKEKEDSHGRGFEPYNDRGINVVIDDFVATGDTLLSIVQRTENFFKYISSNGPKEVKLDIPLHVLMILDWEDAPTEITDKFKHKIGTRI